MVFQIILFATLLISAAAWADQDEASAADGHPTGLYSCDGDLSSASEEAIRWCNHPWRRNYAFHLVESRNDKVCKEVDRISNLHFRDLLNASVTDPSIQWVAGQATYLPLSVFPRVTGFDSVEWHIERTRPSRYRGRKIPYLWGLVDIDNDGEEEIYFQGVFWQIWRSPLVQGIYFKDDTTKGKPEELTEQIALQNALPTSYAIVGAYNVIKIATIEDKQYVFGLTLGGTKEILDPTAHMSAELLLITGKKPIKADNDRNGHYATMERVCFFEIRQAAD